MFEAPNLDQTRSSLPEQTLFIPNKSGREWPPPRAKGRTQKLRASCDTCAKAKLKCNQGRPACARCLRAGLSCNYSLSRRMGRPPNSANSARLKLDSATQEPSDRLEPCGATVIPSHDPYATAADDFMNSPDFSHHVSQPSLGCVTLNSESTISLPLLELNQMSDFSEGLSSCSSNTLLSTPALTPFKDFVDYPDTWSLDSRCSSLHQDQYPEVPVNSIVGSPVATCGPRLGVELPQPEEGFHNAQTPSCAGSTSCTTVTDMILRGFMLLVETVADSRTNSSDEARLLSVAQALITSHRAISTPSTVLHCSCASDFSMILTIALIIQRMTSAYRATARNCSPGSA